MNLSCLEQKGGMVDITTMSRFLSKAPTGGIQLQVSLAPHQGNHSRGGVKIQGPPAQGTDREGLC